MALLAAAVLAAAMLAVAAGCTSPGREPVVEWVAPDGYEGWLVIAWNCPTGARLDDLRVGRFPDRYRVALGHDGTACVADPFPARFVWNEYRHSDGTVAPVVAGGQRGAPESWVVTPDGATPTATGPDYSFSYASIGIADDYVLGDACEFERFLADRFGQPAPSGPCPPMYHTSPPRSAPTPTPKTIGDERTDR